MTPQNELLECCEDFYYEEGSRACFPSCYSWKESSHESTVARDVILLISVIIGVISALVVIIISVIRFKKMYFSQFLLVPYCRFVFPAVFIVYLMVDILVVGTYLKWHNTHNCMLLF